MKPKPHPTLVALTLDELKASEGRAVRAWVERRRMPLDRYRFLSHAAAWYDKNRPLDRPQA